MLFQAVKFEVHWLSWFRGMGQNYIWGLIEMVQPNREYGFFGYAHWPVSRKAEHQARTAEELYDLIDWNYPSNFETYSRDSIELTTVVPPKQLKIGDEVWNIEQPPRLHREYGPYILDTAIGTIECCDYRYEAVLYRYSTDRQTMQFGRATWRVSLLDEEDVCRDPNIPYPPLHNNDYFPFTYWELPDRLDDLRTIPEDDTEIVGIERNVIS